MSELYNETVIRSPKWWLVQDAAGLVDPPREDAPDPTAWGEGNSMTGSSARLTENGEVVKAWEDSNRARWNGRFCTHGVGFGCEACKEPMRFKFTPDDSSASTTGSSAATEETL